jgi:thiamine biosynthesis lipoprotein
MSKAFAVAELQDLRLEALPSGDSGLLYQRRFRAMNTDIQLFAMDDSRPDLMVGAEQVFHDVEARLSRFRPNSELSLLNSRVGPRMRLSADVFRILELAQHYHHITGGVFDPGILPDLEAAGYDRSFELVRADSHNGSLAVSRAERSSIACARLDGGRLTVTAPAGLRLDLGGIGKGYAVDLSAAVLEPNGDFLIDAGGDIFASGRGPHGDGWLVGVASPFAPQENVAVLRLRNEALATSTTAVRRWRRAGRWLNHLIDPRTGRSVENGVVSVSAVAPSAIEADVYAKTALILGPEDGQRFLETQRTAGLFILSDGGIRHAGDWPNHTA